MTDPINYGFWDLDPEERAQWTERAEEETGMKFHDIPAGERGRWYAKATGQEEDDD